MKKKILIIDPAEIIGGAERFTADMVSKLNTDNFEIHIATNGNKDYTKLFDGTKAIMHACPIPRLKPISIGTLLRYKKSQKALRELIKKIHPDILVSNSVRSHMVISPIAKKSNIPLVWIFPDDTFPKVFLKKLMDIPSAILPCSNFIKAWILKQTDKRYESKIHTLYNGIDFNKIPKRTESEKRKFTVGMVGRIVPWKGQWEFLQSANEICRIRDDVDFECIGEVHDTKESKEYFKKLEKFCEDNKITKRIKFKNHSDNIYRSIQSFDILIHASVEPEPFGRVIIESMALGTPVIASNIGGPKEIIDNETDGYLMNPKDTEELKSRILELMDSKEKRETMAKKAYKKTYSNFNLSTIAKQFEDILNSFGTNEKR
jgi:glycosyltransferase involved in cell wall biosynthesis